MYPFSSGMPTAPQSGNPQSMPFGAGFQVQNQNLTPYPPTQANPLYTPYPSSQTPYPSSQTPYPSSQTPYPSSQTPYPSSATPYPPHNTSMPYPQNQFQMPQNSYPTSDPNIMPNFPQQPCYPPSPANMPYGSNFENMRTTGSTYDFPQFPQSSSYPGSGLNMPKTESQAFGSNSRNKGSPTVTPATNFDPVKDAQALRKAMKGFGTDENALIEIICRRSNSQRQEIQSQYKTNFGKDLIEDIKSETSGNFENLLVALLRPIIEFYCIELNDAMAGAGTDEDVLIETLCTLSNAEIHTIKNFYMRMYGRNLEDDLISETTGNFKRLLVSLCTGGRDESGQTDINSAQNDARELLKAGELRVGTDESTFNMILCQRNYQQLKLIFEEYEKITGHSIEKAIKKEFSGDIEDGLIAIYKCVTNKAEYFASRLHKSMAGIGTNDKQLIRVIVMRSEIDLQDIKTAYERLYGKSLKSWIKGDTSGHYKHALYALIGEQRSS